MTDTLLHWTAPDGTIVRLLIGDIKPHTPLREFWLVERHPIAEDAFIRVLADGTMEDTKVRQWTTACLYVAEARRTLGINYTQQDAA